MDRFTHNRLSGLSDAFFLRVAYLQEHAQKVWRSQKRFRQPLSFAGLGVALFLARLAQVATEEESLRRWKNEHLPSEVFFQKTMLLWRGASAPQAPSLPEGLNRGEIWLASSGWVLYVLEPEYPLIFKLPQAWSESSWSLQGKGWEGLEVLLQSMESLPRREKKKSVLPVDPRAIRF